ncbi:AAA family ATPase [Mucilaginibacter sp.]
MLIDKVTLNNYRVYEGENIIGFDYDHERNITIISGNNGFGKTTFLTSLIWCLYGKLMADVDEKYKREIYEAGGYKKYCEKTVNRNHFKQVTSTANGANCNFSVSIVLSRIFIPAIQCNNVEIIRTYNVLTEQESLEILLDNRSNELTKELGPEIFVNDFILPREIAKFFFFDAEKIVSLAEMKSVDEKRQLSRAYSEVLGIKKYEDLKSNLENIRLKLRKNTDIGKDRSKLDELRTANASNEKLAVYYENKISEITEELARKKLESDKCQERLIREGSTITIDELKELKQLRENTIEEQRMLKMKVNELLEFAPLAIASNKLSAVYEQVAQEVEQQEQKVSQVFLAKKLNKIKLEIGSYKREIKLKKEHELLLHSIIEKHLMPEVELIKVKKLLNFKVEEVNNLQSIVDNLGNSYNKRLKDISQNLKIVQSSFSIINNKLRDAETKETDLVIQEIRKEKNKFEKEIAEIENQLIEVRAKLLHLNNERSNQKKLITELTKKTMVIQADLQKDQQAARLIDELAVFTQNLKHQKKESLQEKILSALKKLMHKANFIARVEVKVFDDLIDIDLYDKSDNEINKDGLSKGEQQLYATALLKALVDESNIRFPLFVDSPLQKFDKKHAHNIVTEFYPSISEQVVLFPLLEKELSREEYGWLKNRINKVYLIEHKDHSSSQLREIEPNELFEINTYA